MAGGDAAYPGSIPQNISPFFDWTYAQVGDVQPEGNDVRHLTFGDPRRGGHGILAFRRDTLVGFNLINCTHLAGKLRHAVVRHWRWGTTVEQSNNGVTGQGIEQILTDRELWQKYSRLGKLRAKELSWPRQSERFLKIALA